MNTTTYELNNARKDSDFFSGKFTKHSPVAEVFSAMVKGEELSKFGTKADKAVKYIKNLGTRAENGDPVAVSELNTLRRFTVETPIMQELNLLNIFGKYTQVGFDETIEREVYNYAGEMSRTQAENGDVVFPVTTKEVYPVPTFTVSGGYAVNYRKVSLGDMSKENEGMEQVRISIRNRALLGLVERVYQAIKDATGVKYMIEEAGLTKTNVDKVLSQVRRWGRPTITADYALISQFTPWAGYSGTINGNTITNVSEKVMNELAQNGAVSMYNGAIVNEMPNPYDLYSLTADGTDYKPLLPAGLGFIIPAGINSPIASWTKGGLTSFSGNNVKNGHIETRFDLEVAVDVAKGQEHRIGLIYDDNIGGLGE